MPGETELTKLLQTLEPKLNPGDYVFCTVNDSFRVNLDEVLMTFKEKESTTIVLRKETADELSLEYTFVAVWITLMVHSSLQAVGLTAAFSNALSQKGISCNVVAAYYHDHIFVDKKDAEKALLTLQNLSK
ncbi:hypothetical protein WSM22_07910 [Cytophagales bacterium WSM2-2]|nr:hypothetical protein WSM22_07910 [Cytophagales bacterium WSM2-2]